MEKIGIFGGAFNPPHNEHITALNLAKKALNLSQCIVIPSYYPPHKKGAEMLSFEDRVDMCKIAFPDDKISFIEKKSEEKNYAFNTVTKIKKENPDKEIYYLIGGDSMADFFTWYKPYELLKLVTLVVYLRESREGEALENIQKVLNAGGKVIKLDYVGHNISSRELRCLASLGEDLSNYVPLDVNSLIRKKAFYESDLVNFAKERMSERTFLHAKRTAIWALELNRKIGLNPKTVFESAILHDIEKDSDSIIGVPKDALNTPVSHQFSGAERAKSLGLSEEVVSAIRYHTTAKPDMTELEMLIYCADMTEPARAFEGVEDLRNKLKNDLLEGFKACLDRTWYYLNSKRRDIYYLTKEAYDFYR